MTTYKKHLAGFSLIEGMVILLFIFISALLVGHFIDKVPTAHELKEAKARQELRLIKNAVGAYTLDLNEPAPTTTQGIAILVDKGYLSTVLLDPWGHAYQYKNPGTYDLIDYWSQGPDGIDSDDDIVGWDPYGSYVR
ncbi:MAG: type II secretion system protein GspG [Litorilituus sp.]|jgi:general secretion pathway protein G|nr:type II secretion system protein GspG [Litorilituus sp.]